MKKTVIYWTKNGLCIPSGIFVGNASGTVKIIQNLSFEEADTLIVRCPLKQ